MALRRPDATATPQLKQSIIKDAAAGDGFLFSGNPHESVPRALFMDTRLTPLERNAWQVFRLMLNDDGITAFPTYEKLGPYLASMPCASKASDETIARALTLLRLTRWLSLVRHRRDATTGRIQGNLYVLHDAPLTPYEAIQLDPHYLGLVSHALSHASKALQRVAIHTLQEIAGDPLLTGRVLPTRLQLLSQQLAERGWTAPETCPQALVNKNSEEGSSARLRNADALSSESEVGLKPRENHSLRNPKADSTVRSSNKDKDVRTVLRAREHAHAHLRLPERFDHLRQEQRAGALAALQPLEPSLQQAVLDEWVARCKTSGIRNPAGYLFGIIQKAIRGEFQAYVKSSARKPDSTA